MRLSDARPLALALLMAGGPAFAAPYGLDDMFAHQTIGGVSVDPKARWAIVQSTRPWKDAPSFDLSETAYQALGQITYFDLRTEAKGVPLLADAGDGLIVGAPSSDGERVIVHRVRGRDREMGVLTLADRAARWSGLTTEQSVFGNTAVWLSSDEILVTTIAIDAPRKRFGRAWQSQEAYGKAWAAAARGETAVTAIGTGRFANVHPPTAKVALAVFNHRTGQTRRILEREVVDFELSPDRRKVAALVEAEQAPLRPDQPVGNNTAMRRRRLVVVDIASGEATAVAPHIDVSADLIAWSPGGDELLAVGRLADETWPQARIWRIGADARTPTAVARRPVGGYMRERVAAGAAAAWLGSRPVAMIDGQWRDPAKDGAVFGPGRLVAADGEALFLKDGGKTWRVDGRGSRLEVNIAEHALRRDPEAGARTHLAPARLSSRDWAPTSARMPHEWRFEKVSQDSGVMEMTASRGGVRRRLLSVNHHMAAIPLSRPLPVQHLDAHGAPLTSWLFLPADYNGPPRPLIVLGYPRDMADASLRRSARWNAGFSVDVHVMTGRGHPVLVPSLPFETPGDPGQGLAAAMLRAVDAAAAQHGVAADRLAVWGHSYGGWAALMAAQQSNRFGVSIAAMPVTNFLGYYAAIDAVETVLPQYFLSSNAAWFDTGRAEMGGPPWTDIAKFARNSPALSADRQKAPALIAYGDMDFTAQDARQMFGLIRRAGGDAQLRTYHGADHEFISPAQLRDFYEHAFALIDAALPPTAPASPAPTPPRPGAAGRGR